MIVIVFGNKDATGGTNELRGMGSSATEKNSFNLKTIQSI